MPEAFEIYNEGEKLKEAGQLEEAAAKFHEAIEADAAYALPHSALAVVYGKLGRHEEAIKHGQKVCELAPDDPFSYTALSVTYVRAGRIPEAEDAKARAAQIQMRS